MKILVGGFVKRDGCGGDLSVELLDAGVVVFLTSRMAGASTIKGSKTHMDDADSDRKSRKISDDSGFYIIDDLDSFLTDTRILAFVRKRYSSKAEQIYR